MSITLDLPQSLENELSVEADSLGLSLEEYLVQIIASGRTTDNTVKTGADLVSYWQHETLIGTRPDIADSQTYARDVRKKAEKRVRR